MNLVTAAFDDRRDAEQAIEWLRSRGVANDAVSVLTRHSSQVSPHRDTPGGVAADPGSDLARGAGTGAVAGAAAGALFGLAALLIPGLGPFIGAGALASYLGTTGAAAAAGALVGGTSGAVAGALSKWGLDQADAHYYGDAVERGAIFIAAELDGTSLTRAQVEEAFRVFNARFASAQRAAA